MKRIDRYLILPICIGITLSFCNNKAGSIPPSTISNRPIRISLPPHTIIDSIVVIKSKRAMYVYTKHKLLKTYNIGLGKQPVGRKHFEGDYKTPEGLYYINGKNEASTYHKNLGISYPNKQDIAYSVKMKQPAGGDVKIHGLPPGYKDSSFQNRMPDWTWGCIAVTNSDIDELYAIVKPGTKILLKP